MLLAYTKTANVDRDGAQRPARQSRTSSPTSCATSRGSCSERFPHEILGHRLRREIIATQVAQPDGQPVGHLVRPPDDRGHRRRCRRHHARVGRGARHLRTSSGSGRRSRRSAHGLGASSSTCSSSCSSSCAGWSSAACCGCCAIAVRRSTSPRSSPSSAPASPSVALSLESVIAGPDARDDVRHRGQPPGRRRPRAARAAIHAVAAAAHRLRRRRPGVPSAALRWSTSPPCTGRCSTCST